jgi:hypothetical protein
VAVLCNLKFDVLVRQDRFTESLQCADVTRADTPSDRQLFRSQEVLWAVCNPRVKQLVPPPSPQNDRTKFDVFLLLYFVLIRNYPFDSG